MIFRTKVCGMTEAVAVRAAIGCGVDAIGFNFHPGSPRFVTARAAAELVALLPPHIVAVGVFVNRPLDEVAAWMQESGVQWAQFHGDEKPEDLARFPRPWYPAVRPAPGLDVAAAAWGSPCLLVDARVQGAYGGTGQTADWVAAAQIARRRPVILAGGLGPDNLEAAVTQVRPQAIDLNSGVEIRPGVKDPEKIAAAMRVLRRLRRGGVNGD